MTGDGSRPLVSLVSAVHGVERYLPDFLASLDAQTTGEPFEVVLVDDGSTDGSRALLEQWASRTALPVTVLTKPNGGQASARNLGLEHARGQWVSFPDPDDALDPDYLATVGAVLTAHPDLDAATCRLLRWDDDVAVTDDSHPLRRTFGGEVVRDLVDEPSSFFMMAAASFFRLDRLRDSGLRYDERVRPNFEDGHLVGRYLLQAERPRVAFVTDARYLYRRRSDGTSAIDGSLADPDRWTTVLRLGHLDLLQRAAATGPVPGWLQQLVVYELSWLMREPGRSVGEGSPAVMAVAEEFHDLMQQVCAHLGEEAVDAGTRGLPRLREALRTGWRSDVTVGPAPTARLALPDVDQGLVRLTYTRPAGGPSPAREVVTVDGTPVAVPYATSRPLRVLGRVVAVERVLWVPLVQGLALEVDGVPATLETGARVRAVLDGRATPSPRGPAALARRVRDRAEGFDGAWVLVDRLTGAGDNAERLFDHLRSERPDVNAWFVVRSDVPAWDELRRRHGRRVVAHGSPRWRRLMLRAHHVLSSHVTPAIMRPEALVAPGEPAPWRFGFLQHGVTKDDISNWLGPKPLDLLVTSSPAERSAFLDDDSAYALTEREVVLTGMPRLDRLRALAGEVAADRRDLVLVCPTWRRWLTTDALVDGGPRTAGEDFADSEYARAWQGLLESERLRDLAATHGLRVAFLPHPDLDAAYRPGGAVVPDHVLRLGYASDDVQELLARARVVVTDYSSLAFDAAYVDRPVVYHQFDRDRIHAGQHIGGRGWFDYERDGFGPVCASAAEVVDVVARVVADGGEVSPEHAARVAATFPARDGRCCERVVAAVEASTRPVPVVSTATSPNH